MALCNELISAVWFISVQILFVIYRLFIHRRKTALLRCMAKWYSERILKVGKYLITLW